MRRIETEEIGCSRKMDVIYLGGSIKIIFWNVDGLGRKDF